MYTVIAIHRTYTMYGCEHADHAWKATTISCLAYDMLIDYK